MKRFWPTFLTVAAMGVFGLAIVVTGSTMPAFLGPLHLGLGGAGALSAAWGVGFAPAILLGGLLADRPPGPALLPRGEGLVSPVARLLLAAALFEVAGFALFGLRGGLAWNAASEVLIGFGCGFFEASLNPLIVRVWPERPASALSVLHATCGIGTVGGPALAGWMMLGPWGWRGTFQVGALSSLVLLALVFAVPVPLGEAPAGVGKGRPLGRLFLDLTPLMAAMGLYIACEYGMSTWVPTFLKEGHALPAGEAALGVSVFWTTLVAGRFVTGSIAERRGVTRTVAGLALLAGAGGAGFLLAPGGWLWLLAVMGGGMSGIFPLLVALAARSVPDRGGAAVAWMVGFGFTGAMLLHLVVGGVAARVGLASALWIYPALLALLALLAVRLGHRSPRSPHL